MALPYGDRFKKVQVQNEPTEEEIAEYCAEDDDDFRVSDNSVGGTESVGGTDAVSYIGYEGENSDDDNGSGDSWVMTEEDTDNMTGIDGVSFGGINVPVSTPVTEAESSENSLDEWDEGGTVDDSTEEQSATDVSETGFNDDAYNDGLGIEFSSAEDIENAIGEGENLEEREKALRAIAFLSHYFSGISVNDTVTGLEMAFRVSDGGKEFAKILHAIDMCKKLADRNGGYIDADALEEYAISEACSSPMGIKDVCCFGGMHFGEDIKKLF